MMSLALLSLLSESALLSIVRTSNEKVDLNLNVNDKQNLTIEEAGIKMRVLTAISEMQDEDIFFIKLFIDLINIDRTINKVKSKRHLTKDEHLKMLKLKKTK
ncbi:hypothetical protein ABEG75_19380 [Pantoea agglomerans]|uniref:hypothetical protein n=1 Tax=Enterobacter agglomerans TaxID=549 RepID=UPI000B0D3AF2|nr:hypothetical protein [Pantoea agglomerans]